MKKKENLRLIIIIIIAFLSSSFGLARECIQPFRIWVWMKTVILLGVVSRSKQVNNNIIIVHR